MVDMTRTGVHKLPHGKSFRSWDTHLTPVGKMYANKAWLRDAKIYKCKEVP